MSDVSDYLQAVLGDTEGHLHIAVGSGPHLSNKGKYTHKEWTQTHFAWPAEAKLAEKALLQAAFDSDAYCCPYPMHADKRAQGAAAARRIVHADIDGQLDPDKVHAVNGFAIASGTPGHGHAYVALTESVPAHWHRALCRGLGNYLGDADAKISDNDVLRPPGTLNHKPATRGDEPTPVKWLVKPSDVRVDPHALASTLGVTLPEHSDHKVDVRAVVDPVDSSAFPPLVRMAVDNNSGDRSADTMRVVGACYDSGLTLEQARYVVNSRTDLAGRLADRNDDDVLTCWLKAVNSRQERKPKATAAVPTSSIPLTDAHNTFRRWFGERYDTDALDVMLATAAVEKFDDGSDPIWLLLVSGPGNAKTETVQALDGIGATITSAIASEAALLSATPKRERAKTATGGLLRKLGDRGVLVIKDVTSILSMNRDLRARVLAALREVYDGSWYREVGTDGGQTIPWKGRIAVIGAVTTAWDTAHAVVSSMGDRFVLVRLDSTTARQPAGRRAIGNTGDELTMRAELAAAVAGVLAGMTTKPTTVTGDETDALLAAADLVTLARTGVEYDYRGDVIDAHAPEMPTRFAKQLAQIVRGAVAVGMDRPDALRLALRCARDSMPPLRLAIIDDLAEHPHSSTAEVRKRLDKPRSTVDRQLQSLHMLGVLSVEEIQYQSDGRTKWFYSLADGIDPGALNAKTSPDLSVHTPSPSEERDDKRQEPYVGTDKSGDTPRYPTGSSAECQHCGQPIPEHMHAQRERGYCHRTPCRTAATDGAA